MNNVLVTIAPAIEALTSRYWPERSAVSAMTSSVRLPSVALSSPPTVSPVLAATDSVAWLRSVASGTIAITESTNRSVWAPGARASARKTAGTNASSHNIGLCRRARTRAVLLRGASARSVVRVNSRASYRLSDGVAMEIAKHGDREAPGSEAERGWRESAKKMADVAVGHFLLAAWEKSSDYPRWCLPCMHLPAATVWLCPAF